MVRVSLCILCVSMVAHLAACCLPPANSAYQQRPIIEQRSEKQAIKKSKRSQKKKKSKSHQQAALNKEKGGVEPQGESAEQKSSNNKPPLTLLRQIDNLPHPQSILYDEKRLRFYVSRLGAQAENSKGSIALLSRDGSIINSEWISGLDQPRGMAMVDQYLYVADGKSLLKIDVETAKVSKRYERPSAFYLYDVSATNKGDIFITDPLSNTILLLSKDEELKVWLEDKSLEGPNSVIADKGKLYISSIGLNRANSSQESGKIYKIDQSTKEIEPFTKQKALKKIASLALDEKGSVYAATVGAPNLLRLSAKDGELLENINVQEIFNLKDEQGLADFIYFPQSKEFWVPVKNNGHILVFVRSDATLLGAEPN